MSGRLDLSTRVSDAATRFGRVVYLLEEAARSENKWTRSHAGNEAAKLLWKVLEDALPLVALLDVGWEADEDDDERFASLYDDERWEEELARETARALHEMLKARHGARNRRLIAKLEQVDGRTPEEAAAFLAKARELRGETP